MTIYCACNALQFNKINKNGNKHQILSSVYDVIKFTDNKKPIDGENRGPLMSAESMPKPTESPNRRYSIEDYEYVDAMNDFTGAESNHECVK